MSRQTKASVIAHPNIALSKYWGKADETLNLPAVPSLSLTLAGLSTRTDVIFDDQLEDDQVFLNGQALRGEDAKRVVALLDRMREMAQERRRAKVVSDNDFPTAAGSASSASGFAALTVAIDQALNLKLSQQKLSALARRASASAARSIFGGFVELPAGVAGNDDLSAKALYAKDYWDLRVLVVISEAGAKSVGSTEAMNLCKRNAPYYSSWLELAPKLHDNMIQALADKNLRALGPALEQSALSMHACMISTVPPIVYWNDTTLRVLSCLWHMRRDNQVNAWATMDAGPQVKIFCMSEEASLIQKVMQNLAGVSKVLEARPGEGARVL